MRSSFLCVITIGLLLTMDPPAKKPPESETKLWAAITVNRAVFEDDQTETLQIDFALVNDGKKKVDPEIESTQLFVNGKKLKDWHFTIVGGPRDARFTALPPGDHLYFSYNLGRHFKKPGIYRIHWKGKAFDAPEIILRVVPKSPNQ